MGDSYGQIDFGYDGLALAVPFTTVPAMGSQSISEESLLHTG